MRESAELRMIPGSRTNGNGNGNGNGMPASIVATATAVPPYTITADDVKKHIQSIFHLEGSRLDGMFSIIDNSHIQKRHTIFPLDYTVQPRPLTQTSIEYQEHAIRLGKKVAEDCLARAGMKPEEIDWIITVSCTGYMIPSLDAYLIESMGFRRDVRRLPITEMGCAAGASALARAHDFLQCGPNKNILVISVELPSLTFQRRNFTPANLISSILFGDGAGAVILTSDERDGCLRLVGAEPFLMPNSLDAMGFDLKDEGFHIVLSRDVPELLRGGIRGVVEKFLGRFHLGTEDLSAYLLHPGGRKLLDYMESELGICKCETQPSWDILSQYGNLSSASVLFVLHEWLTKQTVEAGKYGMMAAFGPGFTTEMLLMRWA